MVVTNAMGARVWPRLGSVPFEALVPAVAEEFGTSSETVRADLTGWLTELERLGFVVTCGDGTR
jgi:hypothetical protein